jgi:carbon storage regulator
MFLPLTRRALTVILTGSSGRVTAWPSNLSANSVISSAARRLDSRIRVGYVSRINRVVLREARRHGDSGKTIKEDSIMLVLSRKPGEAIVIGNGITVTVVEVKGERVRLGLTAPAEVPIHREELQRRIEAGLSEMARG